MNYRDAADLDIKQIENLLRECGLPYNDLTSHIENFIVAEKRSIIIGVGGFEIYGEVVLIRSLAVSPEYRGIGVGGKIYALLERKVSNIGLKKLYLLTETAADYFKKTGFMIRDRGNIPEAITQTKQFKELCPSTAVVMYNELQECNE
ncbi:MAG: arsenic resistance N-acetyltransferase ArsN2 [Gammaproteobacteria bacterium]|nr:arsenic resistance N-acetyltransferase ArsN2 [Gammaproteobacteria bacterium]